MTRTVFVFEDGTALVDGITADATGDATHLPFLTEEARVAAARCALALDDWEGAEDAAARGVVTQTADDLVTVTFVAPPEWTRYGNSIWNAETGAAHAVFFETTLLVDGVAVRGSVGLPFEDETARHDCTAWCLRNGLEKIAGRVGRTPVGGDGPYCTWPDADVEAETVDLDGLRQTGRHVWPQNVTDGASARARDAHVPDDQGQVPTGLYGDAFGAD